jgi:hypothetical protein
MNSEVLQQRRGKHHLHCCQRSSNWINSEVERLRRQVKELKRRLESAPSHFADAMPLCRTPSDPILPDTRQWHGVYITNDVDQRTQIYGPSSQVYFLHRLTTYSSARLKKPKFDLYNYAHRVNEMVLDQGSMGYHLPHDFLDRDQQNTFIDLFWESYHVCFPLIIEKDFRELYESLWSGSSRRPCQVVEIVLALCMQWGTAMMPRSDVQSARIEDDPSLAGRSYYRRCIQLLRGDMEQPTLETLQAYIFAIIYLKNASFDNSAQALAAKAIRIASIVGIDKEPPADLPELQKDLRRRLWWALRTKDTELGTSLGRPSMTVATPALCSLPSDTEDIADAMSGSFKSPRSDLTWLTHSKAWTTLIHLTQSMHSKFEDLCHTVMKDSKADDIYGDDHAREECAQRFVVVVQPLQKWEQHLPAGLKTSRREGQTFSTDKSPVILDPLCPLWLQRQKLMIELKYHHSAMLLFRQFMLFAPMPSKTTPMADNHVRHALSHALAITYIFHQVLKETDLLNMWYHALHIQEDAMSTMAGFVTAYPMCAPVLSARKGMAMAIEIFDQYGEHIQAGTDAATLARELKADAEAVVDRIRKSIASEPPELTPTSSEDTPSSINTGELAVDQTTLAGVGIVDETMMPVGMDMEPLWPVSLTLDPNIWDDFT